MVIRSGQKLSTERKILGGSPQGTKLGNYLFCASIDDIMHDEGNRKNGESDKSSSIHSSPESAIPHEYVPAATSTPSKQINDDSFTPNPFGLRKKKFTINDTIYYESEKNMDAETNTWAIGYVDDLNVCETLKDEDSVSTFSTRKTEKVIHAHGCESAYMTIEKNGEEVGLKINPDKTNLICFSDAIHSKYSCYININGKKVRSSSTMKMLGFMFSDKPNVSAHVEFTISKFMRAMWSINHLIKANLNTVTLVKTYCSMLRPILEFSSNVFHTMLTEDMSEKIERCQRRIMKLIYGLETDYKSALEKSGIKPLKTRRQELFEKFTRKMSRSDRFAERWLPQAQTDYDQPLTRHRKKYIEFLARTNRLYQSPIFAMRRILNRD